MINKLSGISQTFLNLGCFLILGLMPFHALFAISLGHFFGNQSLWQAWKEVVILGILTIAVISPSLRNKLWKLRQEKIIWIIAAYAIISLLVSLPNRNFETSFFYGVKYNFSFLVLFVLAQLVIIKNEQLTKLIIYPSIAVAVLALLQVSLIPQSFFEMLGYGPKTIIPGQYITDPNSPLRAFASVGGPNQLGAYLLLPLCLAFWQFMHKRRLREAAIFGLLAAAQTVTYSRSAWLGLAGGLFLLVSTKSNARQIAFWAVGGVLTAALVLAVMIKTIGPSASEAFILHGAYDQQQLIGSDSKRISHLRDGAITLADKPLGSGLGSAGPAAFHGAGQITENYYLQIGIEAGLLGLALFLLIMYLLARQLSARLELNFLAAPLLAALCGVSIVNMFLHGWADSTTALVYWGAAGIVIGNTRVQAKKV